MHVLLLEYTANNMHLKSSCFLSMHLQDTEIGTPFGGISAFDADSGDNGLYVFSIVATGETVPFTIDDSSGVLQVTGPLDRETVPQYLVSLS